MIRLSERYRKIGTSSTFDGLNKYSMRFKDDDQGQQPTAPSAPSYSSTISDYIEQYPRLFELLKQYAPQEATLSQQIQQQLYPQTAGLQEQMAGIASEGMGGTVPEWYNQNVRDTLKSQFGRNLVYNPQAQEQYGLATNQAKEDWKRYYQNLGLTVSGRQALTQPTNQITSQYSPNAPASFASNIYGTQAGIYGTQSQNYQNYQNTSNPWGAGIGAAAGGLIGTAFAPYTGGYSIPMGMGLGYNLGGSF